MCLKLRNCYQLCYLGYDVLNIARSHKVSPENPLNATTTTAKTKSRVFFMETLMPKCARCSFWRKIYDHFFFQHRCVCDAHTKKKHTSFRARSAHKFADDALWPRSSVTPTTRACAFVSEQRRQHTNMRRAHVEL